MRTSSRERAEVIAQLVKLGISYHEAEALRRIAGTLRNWFEKECGAENGMIHRDEETGKPYWIYSTFTHPPHKFPIADREAGAKKRLAAIMAGYKRKLVPYIQGDCRGASIYILRKADVKGQDIDSIYTRGVAVY